MSMRTMLNKLKNKLRFGSLDWLSAKVTGAKSSQASRFEANLARGVEPPASATDATDTTRAADAAEAARAPWTLQDLANKLGLSPSEETHGLSWARAGQALSLPPATLDLDLESPRGREQAWAQFLAIRLALDTAAAPYEREHEEAPAQVWRKEDVPELHGQRRPWLVLASTITALEAHLGQELLKDSWHDTRLGVIYVMELGHHLHAMSVEDAARAGLDAARVRRDARQGLFYDSYKVRPATQERSEDGRLRIYHTVEGLGCSRLLLLPDFDYDAAMDLGMAMIPDRDTMIIAQPATGADDQSRARLKAQLIARAEAISALSASPLPPTLYKLTPAAIALA